MSKIKCIISACPDTYSGYGRRSVDFIKALILARPDWDIKILSQRWGNTRMGYLEDSKEFDLLSRIIPNITEQPDIFISITVPNEFQKVGKFNIGVTAGIETTLADPSWIKGANNMDLIIGSSKHSIDILQASQFEVEDRQTRKIVEKIMLHTPTETLFEGIDTEKFYKVHKLENSSLVTAISEIPESFNFLVVGHWLQGILGEDRKNIGYTIKTFLETFKNKKHKPGLILKIQSATSCIIDRENILKRIDSIRKTVKGDLPNIYLLHGDISDEEMNNLYNHPKVKAMVSLTKGEGFGRPLLEFSLVSKPIIASGWSGQLDFLSAEYIRFVKGSLTPLHSSSVIPNMLLTESKWFSPDPLDVGVAYLDIFENYRDWKNKAIKQANRSRNSFSFEKMQEALNMILLEHIPAFPEKVELKLPKLVKLK